MLVLPDSEAAGLGVLAPVPAAEGASEGFPAAEGAAALESSPLGWHPVASSVAAETTTIAAAALRMLFLYCMTPPEGCDRCRFLAALTRCT
ncbi:hypothetical protein AB0K02_33390 [Streptomyces sp. NPDC049597]|uniref:hypothetical protein n=1 Tax=Streptomyces sp. NPDC049597 TaxID=3155276 RepID=UPI003418A1DA